jgi:hypothetical protein
MLRFIMINQHHFDDAMRKAAELAAEEFAKATSE